MSYKVVAGGIQDPGSIIEPGAIIKLIAKTNVGSVYKGGENISLCDTSGNYSINVAYGTHDVMINYGQGFNRVGQIQVVDDTPTPIALSVLLGYEQIPTNSMVLAAQQAAADATTQAAASAASASSAASDAANVSASSAAIATNTSAISGITADLTGSEVAIGAGTGTGQGQYAVAVGRYAGQTTQGVSAVAVGRSAGYDTQGNSAVAIGNGAAYSNQGNYSVAVGNSAGQTTQGTSSVAVGNSAGFTTQGDNAVAVGYLAGKNNQSEYSVAVGPIAGWGNQPSNSICLNSDGTQNNPTATNSIVIGRSNYDVQIGDGNIQSVSDARDKFAVEDLPLGLDFINALSPKFYKYDIRALYETHEEITEGEGEERRVISSRTIKNERDGSKAGARFHSGFLAQDVKQTMDEFGVDFGLYRDLEIKAEPEHKEAASGKLALCYQELIAIQAKAIQELSADLELLKIEVNTLKGN